MLFGSIWLLLCSIHVHLFLYCHWMIEKLNFTLKREWMKRNWSFSSVFRRKIHTYDGEKPFQSDCLWSDSLAHFALEKFRFAREPSFSPVFNSFLENKLSRILKLQRNNYKRPHTYWVSTAPKSNTKCVFLCTNDVDSNNNVLLVYYVEKRQRLLPR